MFDTGVEIEVIRKLRVALQVDEVKLTEIFRQYAVAAINKNLEEQGLQYRVTPYDLKIDLLASSEGDVRGAQALVNKELE